MQPHRRLSHLTPKRITDYVGRSIKKNNAWGFSKGIFSHSQPAKDWMHPRVRKEIRYLVERNILDSRLDSRENLERFLDDCFKASQRVSSAKEKQIAVEEVTSVYLGDLVRRKRPDKAKEFLEIFRITIERINERVQNLVETVKLVSYEGRTPENNFEREMQYFRHNARDAFSQIVSDFQRLSEETGNILLAIDKFSEETNGR